MQDYKITLYTIHLRQTSHTSPEGESLSFGGYINIGGAHEDGSLKELDIFFLRKNSPVPLKNAYKTRTGKIWMYAPIEEMPIYIDVLRNESPTWIQTDSSDPDNTQLVTSWQVAGEGE